MRLGRQELHSLIGTGRPPLDDLDAKMLTILNKFLFELTRSIAETLCVADLIVLLHLYESIGFRWFYLHWVPHLLMHDLCEKQKEYAKRCFHSYMLPSVIVGITLQPVMSLDFS
jgi:hypothetical protein